MKQVIIGRFQTNELHEGHLELIRKVKAVSDNILILIGTTAATGTDKNPLSFEVRKHLFDSHLSNADILPLQDLPSDKDWSNQIDYIIDGLGSTEATIWGGRDNSIEDYYTGKHKIRIIEQEGHHSATSIRKEVAREPINCPNFRAGIIHHVENRWPIVYSTVDVVLFRDNNDAYEVLVGKKGDKFAFIGGFVDPSDNTLEAAAIRELKEETGIEQDCLTYKKSIKIEDARYNKTKDSIMTHIFTGKHNELPDESKIQDKEFSEFRFIGKDELHLIQDCHKPIAYNFFNLN